MGIRKIPKNQHQIHQKLEYKSEIYNRQNSLFSDRPGKVKPLIIRSVEQHFFEEIKDPRRKQRGIQNIQS